MEYRPDILLHPNIPKPLHGLAPRVILGKEWWDIKRQKAYKEYDYHCWACGISKFEAKYHQWLEGHEYYKFNYETGELKLIEIVALCHSCHNYIHDGRMNMLVQQGKMENEKYVDIINHGENILKKAGHEKFKPDYPDTECKWNDYHLSIDGKQYYSKFDDYDDWYKFYNGGK